MSAQESRQPKEFLSRVRQRKERNGRRVKPGIPRKVAVSVKLAPHFQKSKILLTVLQFLLGFINSFVDLA